MKPENTQIEMNKGVLDLCALHIISRGEIHSSEMIQELTKAELLLVEGAIYPILYKFKKAELISYRTEESKGIPRKYYQITERGTAFLAVLEKNWEHLMKATNELLTISTTTK